MLLFVSTRIVAFVLLSFVISVSVVIPASHRTFLLWVGSNCFSTVSVSGTIIWCTFSRHPWSAPHVVCARHLIILIFFSALAFVFSICSSQCIPMSNVSPKMRCCLTLTCSIFSSFHPYDHFGSGGYW
jgi:hypothetical protein